MRLECSEAARRMGRWVHVPEPKMLLVSLTGSGKDGGVVAMSADPQKYSSPPCALMPSCQSPWQQH